MNQDKRKGFWNIAAFFLFSCLIVSACKATPFSFAKVTPQTSTSMIIYEARVRIYAGRYGMLHIGANDVGGKDAAQGAPEETGIGLSAVLWLVIEERSETYSSTQIHAGQVVNFEGYEIKILRIDEDSDGFGFVEVEVTEA